MTSQQLTEKLMFLCGARKLNIFPLMLERFQWEFTNRCHLSIPVQHLCKIKMFVCNLQVDKQPIPDNNYAINIFYVVFITMGSFFILNLFIGVIIENFSKLKQQVIIIEQNETKFRTNVT